MRRRARLAVPLVLALGAPLGCSNSVDSDLPMELPFDVPRQDQGEPMQEAEIHRFTRRLTAFWKEIGFFSWALSVSHGLHESTGMPPFAVWWQDMEAWKEGEVVTFRSETGPGAHNIYVPTSKLLAQASAGYLLTGDPEMGRMVKEYSRGMTAAFKGMMWDEDDPSRFLMARNVVTHNHEYTLPDGRKKAVDYSPWHSVQYWDNAERIHFPNNPTWGDIYVTNMRSKDDVPHIYMATFFLAYVAELADDPEIREAAGEAYEYLLGFAKDIVDSGYHIRTKGEDGQPYTPELDLASFVQYEGLVENAECNAKLASALFGTGGPLDNRCEGGDPNIYEAFAGARKFWNYRIVRTFHMSSVAAALLSRQDEVAEEQLLGLIRRIDGYNTPNPDEAGQKEPRWQGENSVFMVEAAAVGYPLTSDNVRQIYGSYVGALDDYEAWPRWNLWDEAIADGFYDRHDGFKPGYDAHSVYIYEMAKFLLYCFSPLKNPAGVPLVDCEMIADPARWGDG